MSELSEDDLLAKHRKERKDLQAQIQSLKKSSAKSDKKKKKEITETIVRLEQELDERQTQELDCLKPRTDAQEPIADQGEEKENSEEENGEVKEKNVRVTKAQKRRNKKATEDKEREERIQVQEEENKKGPRLVESDKISRILSGIGLRIYSIPADGNCLYCSVNHQLKITGREELSVSELRKLTASYMREHKEDILPFMSHSDLDEVYTEEQYEKYCNKVANTTEWGGQIEILALSSALKCPIKVIQATSGPTMQGEHFPGEPLVLTYHRHLYRLGEHYNSTAPI